MDRETFVQVLAHAPAFEGKEPRFEVAEDYRISLYLGRPGRAVEVTDIRAIVLERHFVIVDRGGEGTLYIAAEDVHAVAVRPTKAKSERRAGFL
jgi:hypothetical protein